jgi:hypothetical protein
MKLEQQREPLEKRWRNYFVNVEKEKQSRQPSQSRQVGTKIVQPSPEIAKKIIKQIWQAIFQKSRERGGEEDPDQLKLPLTMLEPKRGELKKIQPYVSGLTSKQRRKKYLADFGRKPFYIDIRKWLDDNFTGDVYTGPDLVKWGFCLADQSNLPIQRIKPWERVKYPWIFQDTLESTMRSWNYSMARKLGLVDPTMTNKEIAKAEKERQQRPVY